MEHYFKKHHFWKGLGYPLWDFCPISVINEPNVIHGYIKEAYTDLLLSLGLMWLQLMAGFHSGRDTGRKAEFLEEA